jgi:ribosomal protein S1
MTWQEIKSKYELGSIYNLQVENILTDAQLVLFKIEGYDCRLHVSNIATETMSPSFITENSF